MTSFGGGARKQLNCADNGGGQGWEGGDSTIKMTRVLVVP